MRPEKPGDFSAMYDNLYDGAYRQKIAGDEFARLFALKRFLPAVTRACPPRSVLDYGAGAGIFIPLWESAFPNAELQFCDISERALERLATDYPRHRGHCHVIRQNRVALPDAAFDLVISIEVIEHVESLDAMFSDIWRVLKPGGLFIWTTPCANRGSIEHLYSLFTRQIQKTAEGYVRWAWEDPTHVRRMRSTQMRKQLRLHGFELLRMRFAAHFFRFLLAPLVPHTRRFPTEKLMCLDYAVLRRFPFGACMIGAASKRA